MIELLNVNAGKLLNMVFKTREKKERKNIPETPFDDIVQQEICCKNSNYTFITHFMQRYQTFIPQGPYRFRKSVQYDPFLRDVKFAVCEKGYSTVLHD